MRTQFRFGMGILASVFCLSSAVVMAAVPEWKNNAVYQGGDQAHTANTIFQARYWTQGDDPTASGEWGPWKQVGLCDASCSGGDSPGDGGDNPGDGDDSASDLPQPLPGGGYSMKASALDAAEAGLTDTPQFNKVKDSVKTLDNAQVEAIVPGAASNPANVKRVESIMSSTQFEETFPQRHESYTYTRFLRAVGKFKGFCSTYDDGRDSDAICRKSLATMFAHFTQETGGHDGNSSIPQWRQGLVFVREAGCDANNSGCGYNAECSPDTWQGKTWPCGKDASGDYLKYFGRGAKQLSYNYNYGPFSQAMYGDVRVLLNDPEKVADTWLNLASAVFFFVYPASPKPSMLHVVDGTWTPNAHDAQLGIKPGFGATTNIINGGIECGHGYEKPQSVNRIDYYRNHAQALNVAIGANEELGCKDQKSFDTQGSGALQVYWDQDWGYYPDMPEGKSFACKLVGYQTPYFALAQGDYRSCVENFFDVTVVTDEKQQTAGQ
ncbi:chitin-binding protein [Hahella sp. KA22]|uniref:glycoside hydrolase family 19 protein n=1 Tax=Hahella sp. KA22 TaxID=1628392 RepID=UPI000FDEEF48|nr:glycoside hydrolase family 19 protein [Hahella sp. KA22]AZZ94276.1 chitin-binding protein [Hahella sp. KA22]QAY57650.1 chitin-binding protein [Hahella sp. KA22]